MILELGPLFAAAVGYLLLLFLIAYATERGVISQHVARHPPTYALPLGVYASSWTYYGSVEFAKANPAFRLPVWRLRAVFRRRFRPARAPRLLRPWRS